MINSQSLREAVDSIAQSMRDHKYEFKIIAAIGIALLCYTSMRAALLSFTHDEGVSYKFIHLASFSLKSANNHWVNTLLMAMCGTIFGESELSLRLPNVFAHVLFILFSFLTLCRLKSKTIAACGFLLLNINPFMLDFFSLARGYGLSLAFLMGSIFFLVRPENEQPGDTTDYFPVFFFSALAVFSNFTLLNFHFAVLVILGTKEFIKYGKTSGQDLESLLGKHDLSLWVGIGTLVAAALALFYLDLTGQLYFGGNHGFWADTVHSLLKSSMYFRDYGQHVMDIASISIMAAICIITIGTVFLLMFERNTQASASSLLICITLLCAASCLIQFHLFGALYPMERTALYFLPLFVLSVVFFADHFTQRFQSTGRIILVPVLALASILACWNFLGTANLAKTYSWCCDANTKDMVDQLSREYSSRAGMDKPRKIELGVDWMFEPAVNYYRLSRRLTWLDKVTRDDIYKRPAGYDYYYVLDSNKAKLMKCRRISVIKTFLPAETDLMMGNNIEANMGPK
ncbi:MAG: ArnT family glycosyltransferase [Syntrophobacteraceae bacterium]